MKYPEYGSTFIENENNAPNYQVRYLYRCS